MVMVYVSVKILYVMEVLFVVGFGNVDDFVVEGIFIGNGIVWFEIVIDDVISGVEIFRWRLYAGVGLNVVWVEIV